MRRIEIYDATRTGQASRTKGGVEGGGVPREREPLDREPLERLAERLGGRVLQEGGASLIEVVRSVGNNETRGKVDLGGMAALEKRHLEVLFPEVAERGKISPGMFLFFDIETTGLSGGAGTRFFLIGLLESTEGEMRLVQYFLPNLRSEPLFLRKISQRFTPQRILVSYNGKSFDYNVMRNRFVMNGLDMETEAAARLHLDLLYSSRRLWKTLCPGFTLSTVERVVLGYSRRQDIPGEMIPDVYFRYLGGRNETGELESVLEHNRDDIISLSALLIRQVNAVREGCAGINKAGVGVNVVSLADMLCRIGRNSEARRVLLTRAEETEAAVRLGLLCKREGAFEDALGHFGTLLRGSRPASVCVFACTEIAKIYEHTVKDYETALSYANRARERLSRRKALYRERGAGDKEMDEVERRIARLLKKRERQAGRSV